LGIEEVVMEGCDWLGKPLDIIAPEAVAIMASAAFYDLIVSFSALDSLI